MRGALKGIWMERRNSMKKTYRESSEKHENLKNEPTNNMLTHAIPMRFRRDVQRFVAVVVGPKAFRIREVVSSVEGSVSNVVSAAVVTLISRKHANVLKPSPSGKEYGPAMSTNSHLCALVAVLPQSLLSFLAYSRRRG
jgi:hypothetical protein